LQNHGNQKNHRNHSSDKNKLKKMTKKKTNKWNNRLQNAFYVGTLASLIFIMLQAYFTRQSAIRASEWEKAKMTIENIERFKEKLNISPLSERNNLNVFLLGDNTWADASTLEGAELIAETLTPAYLSLFDNDGLDATNELIRLIDVMDAFAFPIIMGYASEMASFQIIFRQFYTYSNFIMPSNFHEFPRLGLHAQLLYRLWRIRVEMISVDDYLADISNARFNAREHVKSRKEHLLSFEGEISEASLRRYRRQLDRKLRDVQREIRDFRRNSLR